MDLSSLDVAAWLAAKATAAGVLLRQTWRGVKFLFEFQRDWRGRADDPSMRAMTELIAANTTSLLKKAAGLEGELRGLQGEVGSVKAEVGSVKGEIQAVKEQLGGVDERLVKVEYVTGLRKVTEGRAR